MKGADFFLRDEPLDHLPAELRELLEAARVVIRELVVVEAEQAQERDAEIADVRDAF